MIRINLTPDEELINPYWWVPEVLTAIVVCLVAFAGVQYYLSSTRAVIVDTKINIEALRISVAQLKPGVDSYNDIIKKKQELINKVAGLSAITTSMVKRYRPIILLEHLQNIKPEGVWFRNVDMIKGKVETARDMAAKKPDPAIAGKSGADAAAKDPAAQTSKLPTGEEATPASREQVVRAALEEDDVLIIGHAFDNMLVAEFMSSLKATQAQDVDPSDLRTQVYFSKVELDKSEAGQADPLSSSNLEARTNLVPIQTVNFILKLKYQEREVKKPKPAAGVSNNKVSRSATSVTSGLSRINT